MDLYRVYPQEVDWCCYVTADTRGKAKAMLVGYFDGDNKFTDFGARIVAKDVGGEPAVYDTNCDYLKSHGIEYCEDFSDDLF